MITPLGTQQTGQCDWKYVAYGNGRYFVSGKMEEGSSFTAPYMTSSDGENWNLTSKMGTGYEPIGVAFGNDKFITSYSTSYSTATYFVSNDWNFTGSQPHSTFIPYSVAYGDKTFVMVGKQDGYGYSYTMDDYSTTWTRKVIGGITPIDITFNGDLKKFIALGEWVRFMLSAVISVGPKVRKYHLQRPLHGLQFPMTEQLSPLGKTGI